MKVVLVSPGLTPEFGGSAVSEASLAANLGRQVSLTVLCRAGKKNRKFCEEFGLQQVLEYRDEETVRAFFKKDHWLFQLLEQADVVHLNGHWRWENYFFAHICEKANVPYVLHPRGMLVMNQRRPFAKRVFNQVLGNYILKHAGKVIALSHFELDQFKQHPISSSQQVVIPNGISRPDELFVNGKRNFFLYLGRIEQRKNLIFLVQAFGKYLQMGGNAELHLVGPVERDYNRAIVIQAKTLGIQDRVHFPGPAYGVEKWEKMGNAIAVVYPTIEEVFGRVPFEAIALGTPVIIPNESGSAEYLKPYFSIGIYDSSSLDSLANTLVRIEGSKKEVEIQVSKARNWVQQELDWESITGKVLKVYADLTEGS